MSVVVKEIQTSGMNCPMPLLKAKQALNSVNSGEQIKVIATDRGSWRDFSVFAERSGHILINAIEENGVYSYWLEKK
ncbi:MAG: tRNA 2-thiouridine synthesizing protein A [Paraglaciecola psychrophila]|jgi:tRNA 2-thiouridine synthesizing protein A